MPLRVDEPLSEPVDDPVVVAELDGSLLRRQLGIGFHHPPALVVGEQLLLQACDAVTVICQSHDLTLWRL